VPRWHWLPLGRCAHRAQTLDPLLVGVLFDAGRSVETPPYYKDNVQPLFARRRHICEQALRAPLVEDRKHTQFLPLYLREHLRQLRRKYLERPSFENLDPPPGTPYWLVTDPPRVESSSAREQEHLHVILATHSACAADDHRVGVGTPRQIG